jgi:cytochrome c biogenesis protein CcdA/glutaredoxin
MTSGKNLRRQVLSFSFLLFWLIPALYSQELLFFYEKGCPYCAKINAFLDKRIRPNYPVVIKHYEIHQPEQAKLMMDLAKAYRAQDILDKGTPAVFIGDSAFQGSNRFAQRKIEEAVRRAVRDRAASPLARLPTEKRPEKPTSKITLPAVIGAAAVDAINPCACAVLVLLLGTILAASKRKRAVLGAGFSFTAACFISYFLMGIGLFAAIQVSGIQHYIYIAVSLLAIFLGLWNTKDFIWKGRWFSIEVPRSWQPVLKRLTSSITSVLGAFFIGFLISLFLLPCTSGPYVVVIGMLSSLATRMQAVWLLLLYNLIFIQPFIIITLAVGFGFTTTARVEKWRQEKLRHLHLFSGLFLLALGVTLIILLILGTI